MSKTVRQFQCRDDLWTRVDALAKRRGISTDDVIQHALMQLFKTKKKEGESSAIQPVPGTTPAAARPAAAAPAPAAAARPAAPAPTPTLPRPPGPPQPARPPAAATTPPAASPPASASSSGLGAAAKSATMAPKLPRPATAPAAPAPAPVAAPPPSMAPATAVPKPAPSLPRPQPAPAPARLPPPAAKPATQQVRPLYLMFENQWYEVDKEEFVIGRGQKFSDLPIKDANISRRHCSIVRRGADYFIKDLGSTNGVEFEGTRVDNHKIVEGSVYFLCDHELRFSFTPPSSAS